MATTIARLEAILSANTRDFDRAMARSETRMGKVGKVAGVAGLAIAGGLAIGIKKSVDEAMEAERVQARLAQAFKTAGLSIKPYAKSIEEADKKTRRLGFSDEDARDALGSLIVATHSYKKANKEMATAMDIARFKGIDLVQATKMLTMAQAGSQRATKQLGLSVQATTINQDKAKEAYKKQKEALDALYGPTSKQTAAEHERYLQQKNTLDLNYAAEKADAKVRDREITASRVIGLVTEKLHGQADAYSKTAAGAIERFHAQTQELEEQLGKALIPTLTAVTGALATLMQFFQDHTTTLKIFTVAVGALGTALLLTSAYTKIAASSFVTKLVPALRASTAAMLGFDTAADANPIGAIIVSVAALSAGLIILQAKYQGVTRAVDFLSNHLYILMAIPVVGWSLAATAAIVKHWGTVKGVFEDIITVIRKINHWLEIAVGWVKDFAKWVGKIHFPSLPSLPSLPFGDGGGGGGQTEGRAFHVGRQLWDEISVGERAGLHVTSGYRPGAVTKHGTKSDHSYFPSRAVDMSGPPGAMASLFSWLIGRREIRQAFYDPLGSIFNGAFSNYREGGHSDHIHIAEYDRGGWLKPGWNLAWNGLGRPEPVGGSETVVIPVSIGGQHVATVLFDMMRRKARVFEDRNARPAFGAGF